MRHVGRPLFLIALIASLCLAPRCAMAREVHDFNAAWRFARGPQPGAEAPALDDQAWAQVRLPHDWAISGPYEPQGDPHTGKLPWRGEGWYRKSFYLPPGANGQRVYLDFDGVMAQPKVYLNGHLAGGWDYGYLSFRVDATDHVRAGETNWVSVHVDSRGHQSRWYPGAGIYRKVRLVLTEPIHVPHWGTFVTTPEVTDATAQVQIQTTVENHLPQPAALEIETTVLAPNGRRLGTDRRALQVDSRVPADAIQGFSVENPLRWDVTTPRLYAARTRVFHEGRLVDEVETPFGIRTIAFTADDGFHLNGRRLQLHGVNLHHDHGPLGAAFFPRAMERQLRVLRDMGVNAIRTSHNPPAPELLDLCDRMGFVVWDEAFDKWDATSTRPNDAPLLEYNRRQIDAFVRRDRNHPSVVLWSAGNEIWDLENGRLPDPPGLLRGMVEAFKDLDPTRPVTLAHAVPNSARTALDDSLDVTGWNYQRRYAISRERRPQLPIVYSESASTLSTRGHYELPLPASKTNYSATLRLTSYDLCSPDWGDLADTEFALMERDPFVAGEFVWTGFDYLGEPTPFIARGWGRFPLRPLAPEEESRSSLFGIIDLIGIPKDRYYLYRSYWAPEKKTIHLLPHWNWPERIGQSVPVFVYTSGDSAELFLNGTSLGRRTKDPRATNVLDRYRLRWNSVAYEPGELEAVAYRNGKRLGHAVVRTAGPPARLRLSPDRTRLAASGDDLAYVLIEALDTKGNLCPLAMNQVTLDLTGPALLAGVGNGDHHFPAEFVTHRVALFYGKAMAIVRTLEGDRGTIHLQARAVGLTPAAVRLRSR